MTTTQDRVQAAVAGLDDQQRRRLRDRLAARHTTSGAAWYQPVPARPTTRLRLLCFSYAGGGATVFRPWPALIADQVTVIPVQLPGREWRLEEPAYRRLDALIPDLAAALAPLLDDPTPYAIFGHSMGALIGFELTRHLRRAGRPLPQTLLLSAFRAPQLDNPNIRIYHLPDEVLTTVLAKEGTPKAILGNPDVMRVMLPTLRADFELCDTYQYRPQPPLPMPVHVFGGHDDVRVGRDDLDPWRAHTSGPFSLTMLPGPHFFLHTAQDLLLDAVNSHLTRHIGLTHDEDVVA